MRYKQAAAPWTTAHIRLKRIYDERVPPGMNQKEFGKRYGIGGQSMVAQYLNGAKPLNYEAAVKFAKALRCTIFDICPEMAEEIFPVLGKPMRRAAAYLLFCLMPFFTPSDANAASFNIISSHFTHWIRRFVVRFSTLIRSKMTVSCKPWHSVLGKTLLPA